MPNQSCADLRLHHRPPNAPNLGWIRRSRGIWGRNRLAALLALVMLGASCVSAPDPIDWQAASNAPFRSPEGTFHAFKTAAAGDAPDLGYRCLSSGFRQRNGISQLVFRELMDRFPWYGYLSRAEVIERREVGENRVEFVCDIEVLFKTTRVRFGFIREDFFEVYSGREEVDGDLQPFEELARSVQSGGIPGFEIWIEVPPGLVAGEITEIRVGREWKIDAMELASTDESVSP